MDNKTIQAIEAIIKRGNDAEIRRKGDGYCTGTTYLRNAG